MAITPAELEAVSPALRAEIDAAEEEIDNKLRSHYNGRYPIYIDLSKYSDRAKIEILIRYRQHWQIKEEVGRNETHWAFSPRFKETIGDGANFFER